MENASDDTTNQPNAAVLRALDRLLENKFPQQEYTYTLQQATQKGDNYIGVVHRIVVDFVAPDKSKHEEQSFRLILKVPPANPARRKQFFAESCFLRESLAYEEYLPKLRAFQANKGLSYDAQFHEYAECYCSLTEELNEAIFLEDLHVKHFKLFDRFDVLTSSHVALVMRSYAKLHGVSLAMKDQQHDQLAQFQQIEDIFAQRRDDVALGSYFEMLKQNTLASLDSERDERYIDVLERYFAQGKFFDLLLALIDGKSSEPYTVVCHGDCWNNNILFKYEHEHPIDVCLVDWQIMRYASPVTDLMYYIFTCTTRAFRQAHYEEMLNVYHTELSDHIERLGSDPLKLLPREAFDEQLKQKGAIGLLFAMMVLPIITMKSEDTPSLDELSEQIEAGATTDLKGAGMLGEGNASTYNQRMREVVMDCIDYGYLGN